MAETYAAFQWVNSEMRADSVLMAAATGGVFQGQAPIGTIPPFAAYNRQSGQDVMTLQAIRLWSSILLQIKAIGISSTYDTLDVIADRIDALFKNRRNVPLASGGVLACYREQEVAYEEPKPINGVQWSHIGGLYRIDLQAS